MARMHFQSFNIQMRQFIMFNLNYFMPKLLSILSLKGREETESVRGWRVSTAYRLNFGKICSSLPSRLELSSSVKEVETRGLPKQLQAYLLLWLNQHRVHVRNKEQSWGWCNSVNMEPKEGRYVIKEGVWKLKEATTTVLLNKEEELMATKDKKRRLQYRDSRYDQLNLI